MVIRMRHTKSHTRNRRSHHKVEASSLTTDTKTGVTHLRHRASLDTGEYRGRQVLDVAGKLAKKHAKMTAADTTAPKVEEKKVEEKKKKASK